MTTQPAAAAIGANFREMPPPALNRAISTPSKDFSVNSSTVSIFPRKATCFPADLAEARSFREPTGKLRVSRQDRISTPTAPVAPTMATWGAWFMIVVRK